MRLRSCFLLAGVFLAPSTAWAAAPDELLGRPLALVDRKSVV